jgi:transcriptional regulator with XRE-family HTH domain
MKIAAITQFKHGVIYKLLVQIGWTQSELAKRSGLNAHQIGDIINLKRRPSVSHANKIQVAFAEVGIFIDVFETWPETFSGFSKRIKLTQIQDIKNEELQVAEQFYLNSENWDGGTKRTDYFDCQDLTNLLEQIPDKESYVLKKRNGLDGVPKTLKEIGKELKVGLERIRQIENAGLRKIRRIIDKEKNPTYYP